MIFFLSVWFDRPFLAGLAAGAELTALPTRRSITSGLRTLLQNQSAILLQARFTRQDTLHAGRRGGARRGDLHAGHPRAESPVQDGLGTPPGGLSCWDSSTRIRQDQTRPSAGDSGHARDLEAPPALDRLQLPIVQSAADGPVSLRGFAVSSRGEPARGPSNSDLDTHLPAAGPHPEHRGVLPRRGRLRLGLLASTRVVIVGAGGAAADAPSTSPGARWARSSSSTPTPSKPPTSPPMRPTSRTSAGPSRRHRLPADGHQPPRGGGHRCRPGSRNSTRPHFTSCCTGPCAAAPALPAPHPAVRLHRRLLNPSRSRQSRTAGRRPAARSPGVVR